VLREGGGRARSVVVLPKRFAKFGLTLHPEDPTGPVRLRRRGDRARLTSSGSPLGPGSARAVGHQAADCTISCPRHSAHSRLCRPSRQAIEGAAARAEPEACGTTGTTASPGTRGLERFRKAVARVWCKWLGVGHSGHRAAAVLHRAAAAIPAAARPVPRCCWGQRSRDRGAGCGTARPIVGGRPDRAVRRAALSRSRSRRFGRHHAGIAAAEPERTVRVEECVASQVGRRGYRPGRRMRYAAAVSSGTCAAHHPRLRATLVLEGRRFIHLSSIDGHEGARWSQRRGSGLATGHDGTC
jgi:hypothetical protein